MSDLLFTPMILSRKHRPAGRLQLVMSNMAGKQQLELAITQYLVPALRNLLRSKEFHWQPNRTVLSGIFDDGHACEDEQDGALWRYCGQF